MFSRPFATRRKSQLYDGTISARASCLACFLKYLVRKPCEIQIVQLYNPPSIIPKCLEELCKWGSTWHWSATPKYRFHSKRLRSRSIARCSPNRDLENPS